MTHKQKLKNDLFLLEPENADFLTGKSKNPTRTFAGCMTLFMIPFIICGFTFIGFLANEFRIQGDLQQRGIQTTATYIDKDIDDDDDGTTYRLQYEYVVNGQHYQRWHNVSKSAYYDTASGSHIDILYLPDNPATSRLPTNEIAMSLVIFVLVWNAVVLIIFLLSALKVWDNIQLNRKGQLIDGELYDISGSTDGDGDYQITVKFTFFEPDNGEQIHGKTHSQRNDLKGNLLPLPGTRLAIFYLNKDNYRVL
jgi:hypothetical protein